jgi:hypothetical protein
MYSYVTFAWYRPSTGNWIADPSGGIWYDAVQSTLDGSGTLARRVW